MIINQQLESIIIFSRSSPAHHHEDVQTNRIPIGKSFETHGVCRVSRYFEAIGGYCPLSGISALDAKERLPTASIKGMRSDIQVTGIDPA